MTDIDIAKIKEAAEKATPGPWDTDTVDNEDGAGRFKSYIVGSGPEDNWKAVVDTSNSDVIEIHQEYDFDYSSVWDEQGRRNAEFIALSRTAVPALIARLEDAEARAATAYAEGVEAAAKWHEAEADRLEVQMDENTKYMERTGSTDQTSNALCYDKQQTHLSYAISVRALLKDKPNG